MQVIVSCRYDQLALRLSFCVDLDGNLIDLNRHLLFIISNDQLIAASLNHLLLAILVSTLNRHLLLSSSWSSRDHEFHIFALIFVKHLLWSIFSFNDSWFLLFCTFDFHASSSRHFGPVLIFLFRVPAHQSLEHALVLIIDDLDSEILITLIDLLHDLLGDCSPLLAVASLFFDQADHASLNALAHMVVHELTSTLLIIDIVFDIKTRVQRIIIFRFVVFLARFTCSTVANRVSFFECISSFTSDFFQSFHPLGSVRFIAARNLQLGIVGALFDFDRQVFALGDGAPGHLSRRFFEFDESSLIIVYLIKANQH